MWLEQFVLGGEASLSQDASRYATLAMPVLLLWGAEDTITPLARAEALKRLLPSAELVALPGTGHIPTIENPEAFRGALLRFPPRATRRREASPDISDAPERGFRPLPVRDRLRR